MFEINILLETAGLWGLITLNKTKRFGTVFVFVWLIIKCFELNYVYVIDRQVLDRGGGLKHDEAGCMLCCSPALVSWMCQNDY